MKYRSDIDGLRAVAVLAVVLFHGHLPGIPGGFIGVDVFFVISGYLICKLITTEIEHGNFSIVTFYERRCRRILPALFAMFAGVGILASFILLPPDMDSFCKSLVSATFFVSNIFFWRSSNYFDGASEFKPLLHTWSLGVEEQFYIFTPLILLAIAKWSKSRYSAWLVGLSLASFMLSVWGLTHGPTATFYLLPTRFWELALGAILAINLLSFPVSDRVREFLGFIGVGCIAYGLTRLSDESPFPGWNAIYPCLGATLIIYAGQSPGSLVSRTLSVKPLVFIGKISYSLYLWHWPLLALAKYQLVRELTPIETCGTLALGLLISVISWRFVEMPFRHNKTLSGKRVIFAGSAAGMLLCSAVAVAGISSEGFSARYPNFSAEAVPGRERYNYRTCFLDEAQPPSVWQGDSCFLTRGHEQRVLLWGDSFAAHYAPGIVDEADRISVDIIQYNGSACPPIFEYYTAIRPHCQAFNDNVPAIISKYRISAVIMAGRWESLMKRGVSPEDVAATVKRLMSLGVKVYVVGQSPVFNNDIQTIFAQAGRNSTVKEASAPLSFSRNINEKLSAALPTGTFIDPLKVMCSASVCDYRRNGKFLMVDMGHLSEIGSKLAVASYFPFIARDPR